MVAYVTYLIYAVSVLVIVLGGTGYAVFVLGHSGWWLLPAFFVCTCGYTPERWIHGKRPQDV